MRRSITMPVCPSIVILSIFLRSSTRKLRSNTELLSGSYSTTKLIPSKWSRPKAMKLSRDTKQSSITHLCKKIWTKSCHGRSDKLLEPGTCTKEAQTGENPTSVESSPSEQNLVEEAAIDNEQPSHCDIKEKSDSKPEVPVKEECVTLKHTANVVIPPSLPTLSLCEIMMYNAASYWNRVGGTFVGDFKLTGLISTSGGNGLVYPASTQKITYTQ